MKKVDILKDLWEFIEIDRFSKEYWGQYEKEAKKRFKELGNKKKKEDLQHIYNFKNYGYYNNRKQYLYFDVCN